METNGRVLFVSMSMEQWSASDHQSITSKEEEMSELVKVVVDAMGGDNAPQEPVKGAVDALKESEGLFIYLTGIKETVEKDLAKYQYPKDRLEVVFSI